MRSTRFVITLLAVLAPGSALARRPMSTASTTGSRSTRATRRRCAPTAGIRRSASSGRPSISDRMRRAGSRPICAAASAGPALQVSRRRQSSLPRAAGSSAPYAAVGIHRRPGRPGHSLRRSVRGRWHLAEGCASAQRRTANPGWAARNCAASASAWPWRPSRARLAARMRCEPFDRSPHAEALRPPPGIGPRRSWRPRAQ